MMGSGSGHDRRSEPERDLIAEVVDHPGWFERAWATARRARRWIRRKHEPIAEGIETAGRGWTRIARTAARVGRSLSQMGTVIERNGKILSKGRGRGRQIGRNLVTFGGGLRKFGDWLNKTGRSWAPIGETVEDIGEHIGELDISPLPAEESARPLPEAKPVRELGSPKPATKSRPVPAPDADLSEGRSAAHGRDPDAAASHADPPVPTPSEKGVAPETEQELPTELQEAIAGLGKRPRSARLREVIEAICRSREWTTVEELSRFVGVSEKTLRSRHVPEMVKQGRLVRRYPNRPRHRDQAYGVPPSS